MVLSGDIMVDSVEFVQQKIDDSNYSGDDYYLLTLHRPYNVDVQKTWSGYSIPSVILNSVWCFRSNREREISSTKTA